MASLASHLCDYVSFVAEVNEIRQIIDFYPEDRPSLFPVMDKLLDLLVVFPDVLVASHAKLHGRNPRDNGPAGVDMAIETIDLVVTRMELMAEIDGLQRCPLVRVQPENDYNDHEG